MQGSLSICFSARCSHRVALCSCWAFASPWPGISSCHCGLWWSFVKEVVGSACLASVHRGKTRGAYSWKYPLPVQRIVSSEIVFTLDRDAFSVPIFIFLNGSCSLMHFLLSASDSFDFFLTPRCSPKTQRGSCRFPSAVKRALFCKVYKNTASAISVLHSGHESLLEDSTKWSTGNIWSGKME